MKDEGSKAKSGKAKADGSEASKKGKVPERMTKEQAADALRESKKDFLLTYVVVGKRHNAPFYPLQEKDAIDKNGNVKPGLLVDQAITHPFSFDFYLQSHKPLTGTGRAAHYFVLTNQMGLSPEKLQSITHAFCYVYAKATCGVSYCAPAYYADRLCDRGRAYLRHWLLNRGGPYSLNRSDGESDLEFKSRVMRHIYNSDYWRPHRSQSKYGCPRRNPWHEKMDDIMFYL